MRQSPRVDRLRLLGYQRALLLAAVTLVPVAFLALAAEGVVRVRHWLRFGQLRTVEDTFTLDPRTGLRVPIANLVSGPIRINSLGFRSPEIPVPKPLGTVRLAFLGGSTTYCAEVSANEQTWPHLAWRSLATALPGAQLDYVNAGVPGYALDSVLKGFEFRVKPLQPDLVVIYEATNDLSWDSRRAAQAQGLVGERAVHTSWLGKRSLLWFLVEKNWTIRRLQTTAEERTAKLVFSPAELSRDFAGRLRNTVRAAQSAARVVAIVTFSPRLRRSLPPEERRRAAVTSLYYMPYMTIDGLIAGFEEYNRVMRAVAAETNVLLIGDEERIPPDEHHYTDSVHFTDAGSRVMADRVSKELLAAPAFRTLVAEKATESHSATR